MTTHREASARSELVPTPVGTAPRLIPRAGPCSGTVRATGVEAAGPQALAVVLPRNQQP